MITAFREPWVTFPVVRIATALYDTVCPRCGAHIDPGTRVLAKEGALHAHLTCPRRVDR